MQPTNDANQTKPQSPVNSVLPPALTHALAVAHDKDLSREKSAFPRVSKEVWLAIPITDLRQVLDELIVGRYVDEALEGLYQSGCLDAWLPELSAMVGFGDGEWKHKDVWKHTIQVVKQSVPKLSVRWGALLHDIGKIKTRKIDERGRVTFYGHAELGASMFRRGLKKRLAFEKELADRIHFLILYHLRPAQFDDSWTDSAIRRFYKQMGDGLEDLLALGRADITTKRPEKRKRGVRQISLLKKRIQEIEKTDNKVRPLPKGLGKVVMDHFGLPPNKFVGNLMKALEADADDGLIAGGQPFQAYIEYLEANREKFGL